MFLLLGPHPKSYNPKGKVCGSKEKKMRINNTILQTVKLRKRLHIVTLTTFKKYLIVTVTTISKYLIVTLTMFKEHLIVTFQTNS
jgi:hypothetical protein